ncbi:MAG: serine/threonine protein kinase [Kofleriaceae bacterium]|jgi:serine/threonine protein kinase|nr:serine/threonine protein kinase [Kofleriaceae bacterium]MBP9172082.1 serine/threonine protein kinase [Kofleriaceae bacterium]MBP9859600.1 serine/threonine protein kinase [Kofleriaceae bacterium]
MAAGDRSGTAIDGRYRLEKLIGRGAMADVYRARDDVAGQTVAVKILRDQVARDPEAVARFQREADVQGKISHRNVAALYASGVTEFAEPYLVVELLRGHSLRAVLKQQGAVAPARALSYVWQALQGLAAVHAQGVLHRDLKPANLMLEPSPGPVERVIVIDFGFAALEGGAKLTARGHVVGSLTYLAPERLRGRPADARSDLYALGIILYELIAGRAPFVGADDYELISAHLHDDPPPLDSVAPQPPPEAVVRLVNQALAKEPERRFASAQAMASAIEEAARTVATER